MLRYFIIQVIDNGLPCEVGIKLMEACRYQAWFNREQRDVLLFNSDGGKFGWMSHNPYDHNQNTPFYDLEQLVSDGIFIVPVGTLEYCESYMQKLYSRRYIKAINIPVDLREKEFTRRKIWELKSDSLKIPKLFEKYTNLFIKSAIDCKKVSSGIFNERSTSYKQLLEKTDRLFISEVVDFIAEWRVFVYRTNILDIKQYSGDWESLTMIKPEFIKRCVSKYSEVKHSPTYTLDIGLLSSGEMAIIEIHNFISCGLYGFDDERYLPQMLYSAFKYEINNK